VSYRATWDDVHSAAFVAAHNDAPLIDERAAARGRVETEGGDAHGGVKRSIIHL
jgi:hypothetical protein